MPGKDISIPESDKRYRVSVLTPVHHTDFSLLKRAFQSLRIQSYGFSGIEWVVVLHNCSEEYVQGAEREFSQYPNIHCHVANAEGTGVSYARNATIRFAGGEYIFFLDADDEILPDCIREVVVEMDRSEAETAIFAAEVEETSSCAGRQPGSEKSPDFLFWTDTLVDPEDKVCVLRQGDPRIGKSMCVSGKMLWARCYRRNFLIREGIRFNESCHWGEDFLFNIAATGAAQKVLVLPYLLGYRYYAGIGMMDRFFNQVMKEARVQGADSREGQEAGEFLARLFRYGKQCGLDLTNSLWKEMAVFGRWYLFSDLPERVKENYANSICRLADTLTPPAAECLERQRELDNDYHFVKAIVSSASPLVSVIIPVYNGEKYIRESLESVRRQSWRNLEILVVNDGSTDHTAGILEELAKSEPRLHVIHKDKNMQLFHARMTGLENCKGDYVMFLDADDFYSEDYVESLMAAVRCSGAEVALCDNYLMFQDGSSPEKGVRLPRVADRKYLEPVDMERDFYNLDLTGLRIDQSVQVMWSKIYKKELILRALPWLRQVRQPLIYFEDLLYSAILLHLSKCSVYTGQGTYFYRIHASSSLQQDLMKILNQMTTGQLEMITRVRSFLNDTKADPERISMFESWRERIWRVIEFRYALYDSRKRKGTDKKDSSSVKETLKPPGNEEI